MAAESESAAEPTRPPDPELPAAEQSARRPARGRRIVRGFAWILFAFAALGAASYFDAATYSLTVSFASFAPYLLVAAAPALVGFLFGRQWLGAVLSVLALVLLVVTTVPLYVATPAPGDAVEVRVFTVNARLGLADPAAIVQAARESRADLVMVEELSPALQQGLVRAGLTALLPNNRSAPAGDGVGTGLWSRYRIGQVGSLGLSLRSVAARIGVPGIAEPPTVVALHVAGPFPVANSWVKDMARLPAKLDALPADAPVIAAGDFNATHAIGPFRALLKNGYADGGDQAGAGLLNSYPSGNPVIGIDHVLTRGGVVTSARTVHIPGTDHRGLLATVALPRSRTP